MSSMEYISEPKNESFERMAMKRLSAKNRCLNLKISHSIRVSTDEKIIKSFRWDASMRVWQAGQSF